MQGLLNYIIELIVSEDDAFQLIDKCSFRRLLMYLRPSLLDKDIPHRTKLTKEILEHAAQAEAMVKMALKVRFKDATHRAGLLTQF